MGNTAEKLDVEVELGLTVRPKPFLKWVGGKGKLVSEITRRLPKKYNKYFEPFVGGGALFFHLMPNNASIYDINEELINCYLAVKNYPKDLIKDLKKHTYQSDYFYKIRDLDRTEKYKKLSNSFRASRLIYLNKTCFNGLYRVNSKGQFNVPFGDYTNPRILDEKNIISCSKALKDCMIKCTSYLTVEKEAKKGDFVYLDPPYAPLSQTSNFTSYSKGGFSVADQVALRDLCHRLDAKGVSFMLSNSCAPIILDLYSKFNIDFIDAARAINSDGKKRGKIKEVLVTNYRTND